MTTDRAKVAGLAYTVAYIQYQVAIKIRVCVWYVIRLAAGGFSYPRTLRRPQVNHLREMIRIGRRKKAIE